MRLFILAAFRPFQFSHNLQSRPPHENFANIAARRVLEIVRTQLIHQVTAAAKRIEER